MLGMCPVLFCSLLWARVFYFFLFHLFIPLVFLPACLETLKLSRGTIIRFQFLGALSSVCKYEKKICPMPEQIEILNPDAKSSESKTRAFHFFANSSCENLGLTIQRYSIWIFFFF